jgi:hypothetical protein
MMIIIRVIVIVIVIVITIVRHSERLETGSI